MLQDFLKGGYIVQVVSKLCGKSLRVLENGVVDCAGDSGTACELVQCIICTCTYIHGWTYMVVHGIHVHILSCTCQ